MSMCSLNDGETLAFFLSGDLLIYKLRNRAQLRVIWTLFFHFQYRYLTFALLNNY